MRLQFKRCALYSFHVPYDIVIYIHTKDAPASSNAFSQAMDEC